MVWEVGESELNCCVHVPRTGLSLKCVAGGPSRQKPVRRESTWLGETGECLIYLSLVAQLCNIPCHVEA